MKMFNVTIIIDYFFLANSFSINNCLSNKKFKSKFENVLHSLCVLSLLSAHTIYSIPISKVIWSKINLYKLSHKISIYFQNGTNDLNFCSTMFMLSFFNWLRISVFALLESNKNGTLCMLLQSFNRTFKKGIYYSIEVFCFEYRMSR